MPKNRKRQNPPNPSTTTTRTTAAASADAQANENVVAIVPAPIQETPAVDALSLTQQPTAPKSISNAAPAASKCPWGLSASPKPPAPVSQVTNLVESNATAPVTARTSAWGSPKTDASQPLPTTKPLAAVSQAAGPVGPSTIPKPNAAASSTTPKSPWGASTANTRQQSTVTESNPNATTIARQPAWNSVARQVASATAKPSHPSASPRRAERAASVYPMTDETRRNLSVDSGAKEGRARSAFSGRSRRTLYSAVPDSAVLFPVTRPDEGGSRGKAITVYANHFPVHIPDHTINQYDIDIVVLTDDGQTFPARKDERWEILQRISKEVKDFPLVWYDEGKTLYSLELLPDITKPIQVRLKRNDLMKTFQLEIKNLVRQEKLSNIPEFVQKKLRIRPRESVRIIETLLKQTARNDLVAVRNQFYNRNQALDDLGDGRGMAKGFYQALFLTRSGPTLNVNLTFTCFYMPLNFVAFACKYLRKDIVKDGLTDQEAKTFKKIIKDLLIETSHTGRPIRYKLRRFGLPADQLTFARGDTDENSAEAAIIQKISVAEYFEQTYQITLQHPHLPCIDGAHGLGKKAHWLPMEIVKVVDWQRAIKPLDSAQRANVSSKSIIRPAERYDRIMDIMRGRNFDKDPYLSQLGISVKKDEMIAIRARLLDPPVIRYRAVQGQKETIENVNVGKWRIRNFFYRTPEIRNWGLLYFGFKLDKEQENMVQHFSREFSQLLKRKGLIIRSELSVTFKSTGKVDIEQAMTDAHRKGWQLAIIVLNTNVPQVYPYIKRLGNQTLGLKTQCIDMNVIQKSINNLSMLVENISQKINGKLDGINGVVDTQSAMKCSSKDDLFMFFGADVTHSTCSTERPSIAAVVASRDPTNTLYAARLCEQYPKKGRCSVEIIKDLDKMVADLLRVFANNCTGRLPTKIVFYRDGVDEGHYQKVLDNEVKKIYDACRTVYRNQPLPKLTFIIVKKRHNTRFFLYENGRTDNVQAGTVIDCDITHPSQFDFYLCSQAAIMGTSRPTLYHVLHDDTKFSSDDVQQLTYWLCHTDMRCSKSVSIPAPVHYAHLAAYQARTLDFQDGRNNEDYNDDDEDDEQSEKCSLEDIKTKLMILNQNTVNSMWFL